MEYESSEANYFLTSSECSFFFSIGTANMSVTHRCYNKGHNKPFKFSRNFHFCDLTDPYSIAVKKAIKADIIYLYFIDKKMDSEKQIGCCVK